MLKIALVVFKIYVLVGKKGISGWVPYIATKDTANFVLGEGYNTN